MHANPMPGTYRSVHTTELDTALAGLQSLYGDIQGSVRGAFEWHAGIADLGPVTLIRGSWTAAMVLRGSPSTHLLSLPAVHGMWASSPRGRTELGPGRHAAVLSPKTRFELGSADDIRSITVRFDPAFLAAQLEAMTGEVARSPIQFAQDLPLDKGAGAFVERLCHFIEGEIQHGTPFDHPVVMNGLHESLARALLTGQPHDHSHLLAKPAPPSSKTTVRLVEEYADAFAGEVIRASELTKLTGASTASIDAAFRVHRGATPAAFLRARRLERARQALLSEPQVPVMRVANAAGFVRPENFEAAYFKAFRESPTDTRRRGFVTAPASSGVVEERAALDDRISLLSPREREVAALVARGLLNKQIAAELGITERTVKEHRGRALKKLGVDSVAELGRLRERLGQGA